MRGLKVKSMEFVFVRQEHKSWGIDSITHIDRYCEKCTDKKSCLIQKSTFESLIFA